MAHQPSSPLIDRLLSKTREPDDHLDNWLEPSLGPLLKFIGISAPEFKNLSMHRLFTSNFLNVTSRFKQKSFCP